MAKWTETELEALRLSGRDYSVFSALTDGSKTYDAFEVKSRRLSPAAPMGRVARLRTLIRLVMA